MSPAGLQEHSTPFLGSRGPDPSNAPLDSIQSGKNHLYHEGELSLFHPGDIYDQIEASFPYERFSELAGTRFWVVMTNAVLNKEGRMIDFKPVLRQPPAFLQDRPELEAALFDEIKKRLLRTDWTIYRIDGEFTPGRLFEATRSLHLTFPEKEDHTLPE